MNESVFIIHAEEQLKALIKHGVREELLQQMWENLERYAKDYQRRYIYDMKDIPKERLTLLYNTYFIEKRKVHSCVYFVKDNNTGKIKIGVSKHPLIRFKELKKEFNFMNMNPHDLKLIGCIYAPFNAHKAEKYYHSLLSRYRENGEWFNVPLDELENIFSKRLLDGMAIKIKYDNGLYPYDGNKEVTLNNINKKLLMQYAIDDLCNKVLLTGEVQNIDIFKEVCEWLNNYNGNHAMLFDIQKPESFELYEWLLEDNLIDMAKNGDIGFIEDYYAIKKKCLFEYFREYSEK